MTQRGKKSRGQSRNWEAKWFREVYRVRFWRKQRNALSIVIEQLILEIYWDTTSLINDPLHYIFFPKTNIAEPPRNNIAFKHFCLHFLSMEEFEQKLYHTTIFSFSSVNTRAINIEILKWFSSYTSPELKEKLTVLQDNNKIWYQIEHFIFFLTGIFSLLKLISSTSCFQ